MSTLKPQITDQTPVQLLNYHLVQSPSLSTFNQKISSQDDSSIYLDKNQQKTQMTSFRDKLQSERMVGNIVIEREENVETEEDESFNMTSKIKRFRQAKKYREKKSIQPYANMTIFQLLRDRQKVEGLIQNASNRFHYTEHQKQKKLKTLHLKQQKYKKITKIREEYLQQKKLLEHSRVQFQNQIEASKKRSKQIVSQEKKQLIKAVQRSFNERKNAGTYIRSKKKIDQSQIAQQKNQQFLRKKSLHSDIVQGHSSQRKKREHLSEIKKRMATQNYMEKIREEYQKNKRLYNKRNKILPKVFTKIRQFNTEVEKYSEEVQEYSKFLKQN